MTCRHRQMQTHDHILTSGEMWFSFLWRDLGWRMNSGTHDDLQTQTDADTWPNTDKRWDVIHFPVYRSRLKDEQRYTPWLTQTDRHTHSHILTSGEMWFMNSSTHTYTHRQTYRERDWKAGSDTHRQCHIQRSLFVHCRWWALGDSMQACEFQWSYANTPQRKEWKREEKNIW